MEKASLCLKKLDVGFGNPLITEIEAELLSGDLCLLMGNNGVGKTTLIKTIMGHITVLGGDIFLGGNSIKKLTIQEISRWIGVVFSKFILPEYFKVVDLIALGKYVHYKYYARLDKQAILEIEKVVERLNLEPYKNRKLIELSDGNLQKVMIARVLVQNPPLIILDEPTTFLDEKNKLMILNLLQDISKNEKKIVLFSSHDWRLASQYTNVVWYVENGKLFTNSEKDVKKMYENSLMK